MTHPDLLTDEDLATRHEPVRGYFNEFVTIHKYGVTCVECGKSLSDKAGDIVFSCCPPFFPTVEEAIADAEDLCDPDTGEPMVDFLGTHEL